SHGGRIVSPAFKRLAAQTAGERSLELGVPGRAVAPGRQPHEPASGNVLSKDLANPQPAPAHFRQASLPAATSQDEASRLEPVDHKGRVQADEPPFLVVALPGQFALLDPELDRHRPYSCLSWGSPEARQDPLDWLNAEEE